MKKVIYRTDEFFERSEVPVYPCEVPDYRYNQKTKRIEQVGVINIQSKIQSNADCDYRKIFDKFLETGNVMLPDSNLYGESIISDDVGENSLPTDKLDQAMHLYEVANKYKIKLNLDPNLSPSEVFEKVGNYAKTLKDENDKKIESIKKQIESLKVKGVDVDGNQA